MLRNGANFKDTFIGQCGRLPAIRRYNGRQHPNAADTHLLSARKAAARCSVCEAVVDTAVLAWGTHSSR